MNTPYTPSEIEPAIQQNWEARATYKATDPTNEPKKEKFYCLSMLPYPSGELHMGHVRNYTLGDVIARFHAQNGRDVLHPMGWDAFGLPAENAAIKHKVAPAEWTKLNIANMRAELKRLGYSFDWSRELATCDASYYRWEQWLFTRLFKSGLAYKKESLVNWDPVDQTVLANEQVVDGHGWRSGAKVEQKKIFQWYLKITDYAEELLDGLDTLTGWPEEVRLMQKNWIGRSTGATIKFSVPDLSTKIDVYTTRADTLYGVSFLAIAADHPIAVEAEKNSTVIADFNQTCLSQSQAEADIAKEEKKGMDTGFFATHPLTGKQLPIWITNYVLSHVGTGAVMAVPAHDARDFDFAKKYELPILPVIQASKNDWDYDKGAYTEAGVLIHSDIYNGEQSEKAKHTITKALEQQNVAESTVRYRLRDWGISRQRYWGTPIPIIYCPHCGAVPVPDEDLPVVLPTDVIPSGTGSPLASTPSFLETTCPTCGEKAERETDTMDTFVESSWYYARYCCPNLDTAMLDERAKNWTPVDQYIGGIEHAVMHLLYARFMHKVLRDEGLLSSDEPFKQLMTQGMVLKDGHKMSKSKGNVVPPTPLIEKYGADTARLFMMFAAPPTQDLEWSDSAVDGAHRFLKRLWQTAHALKPVLDFSPLASDEKVSKESQALRFETHSLIKQARFDMDRLQINTVVSACMKLSNALLKAEAEKKVDARILTESLNALLIMLTPVTPHITQYLWETLGMTGDIHRTEWPVPNEQALVKDSIEYVIQVNGKLRARLSFQAKESEEAIRSCVLASEQLTPYLTGKDIKRVIIVPKKLVNVVAV